MIFDQWLHTYLLYIGSLECLYRSDAIILVLNYFLLSETWQI